MGFYTAEFSASQNCFHVGDLDRTLAINRGNAMDKRSNDYQILAITKTMDEAQAYCKEFRKKQKDRRRA